MIKVQHIQAVSMGAHNKYVYKLCTVFFMLTNDVMTACNFQWWELLTSNREVLLCVHPQWVAHSVSLTTTMAATLCYLTVHTGKAPMRTVWLSGIWYTDCRQHGTGKIPMGFLWSYQQYLGKTSLTHAILHCIWRFNVLSSIPPSGNTNQDPLMQHSLIVRGP